MFTNEELPKKLAAFSEDRELLRAIAIDAYNQEALGIDKARVGGRLAYRLLSPLKQSFLMHRGELDLLEEIREYIRYKRDLCSLTGLSILELQNLTWSEWENIKELIVRIRKDDTERLDQEEMQLNKLPKTGDQPQAKGTRIIRNNVKPNPSAR